jgi:hypothetical protein
MPCRVRADWTRSCSPTEGDAEIDRFAARALHEGGKGEHVGGDDLVRAGGLARAHQLVAGCENRNARLASDGETSVTHGGCQGEAARVEALTGREQLLTLFEIEPARADEAARGGAFQHGDRAAVRLRVLLDHDSVPALRHRRAREDADRLARRDASLKAASSDARSDDAERSRRRRDVLRPDRIAIHGRGGERRLGAERRHIRGKTALEAELDRHVFRSDRLFDAGEHAPERLLDRQEAHSGSASKVPERPPLFLTTRMPSMRMARSTALTMS